VPDGAAARKALVLAGRLALWDVLERCSIAGASDASISDPVPNDVAGLMARCGIGVVFCNGATAHRLYGRFCLPHTRVEAVRLPSTSPANAAYGFERLRAAWAPLAEYLG
jgi:hypoxanthine-DNA glycosylase